MELSANCRMIGKLSMGYTVEQQADGLAAAIAEGYTEAEIASLFTPIWEYQINHYEERATEYTYLPGMGWANYDLGARYTGPLPRINTTAYRTVTPTVFGPPIQWPKAYLGVQPVGPVWDYFYDEVTNNNRVDSIISPRVATTEPKLVKGPDSIWAFMADYNAAQRKGDIGSANLLKDIGIFYRFADQVMDTELTYANWGTNNIAVAESRREYSARLPRLLAPSSVSMQPKAGDPSHFLNYLWTLGPNEGTLFEYTRCSVVAQGIYTKVYGSTDPNGRDFGPKSVSPATQVDLIQNTRCVIGVRHWDFTHVDGSTRRVGAFVCPLPPARTGNPSSGGSVLTFYPDQPGEMVCDYEPYPYEFVIPDTKPYPWDSDPIPWGGGGGGGQLLLPGKPQPIYPDFLGFLAYDTLLKKWGKAKTRYVQLLDLSPINTNQGKIVTTQRFGMEAASYNSDGKLYRFDSAPTDSYIKYGKIGMHRRGYTTLEEVRVTFRSPVTGTISVSSSLDGRNPEAGLTKTDAYTGATWYNMGVGASGKWHTITIKGNYDITHLEYLGYAQGSR